MIKMKLQLGFVSNSSSSSFVCVICSKECSGMDINLDDFEMSECENEHIICNEHIGDQSKAIDLYDLSLERLKEKCVSSYCDETEYDLTKRETMIALLEDNYDDTILIENCPICQFDRFVGEDVARYFMRKNELTRENLRDLIKLEFKTYDEFSEYYKSVQL